MQDQQENKETKSIEQNATELYHQYMQQKQGLKSDARTEYFENHARKRGMSDHSSWKTPTKYSREEFVADTGSIRKISADIDTSRVTNSERIENTPPKITLEETRQFIENAKREIMKNSAESSAQKHIIQDNANLHTTATESEHYQQDQEIKEPIVKKMIDRIKEGSDPLLLSELKGKIDEFQDNKAKEEEKKLKREQEIHNEMMGIYNESEPIQQESDNQTEQQSQRQNPTGLPPTHSLISPITSNSQQPSEESRTLQETFPRNFSFSQNKEDLSISQQKKNSSELSQRSKRDPISQRSEDNQADDPREMSFQNPQKGEDSPPISQKQKSQSPPNENVLPINSSLNTHGNNSTQNSVLKSLDPPNTESKGFRESFNSELEQGGIDNTGSKKVRRSRNERKKSNKTSLVATPSHVNSGINESPSRDSFIVCPSPEKHKFIIIQRSPSSSPTKPKNDTENEQQSELYGQSSYTEPSLRDNILKEMSPQRQVQTKFQQGMTRQQYVKMAKENRKSTSGALKSSARQQQGQQKEKVVFHDILDTEDGTPTKQISKKVEIVADYDTPEKKKSSSLNPYTEIQEAINKQTESIEKKEHDSPYQPIETQESQLRSQEKTIELLNDLSPESETIKKQSNTIIESNNDNDLETRKQSAQEMINNQPNFFEDFRNYVQNKMQDQVFQKALTMQMVFLYFYDKQQQLHQSQK